MNRHQIFAIAAACMALGASTASAEPTEPQAPEPLSGPTSQDVELSFDLGVKGSEAAFGSVSPEWLFGLRGGWLATEWLKLQGVLDFSPRSRTRGDNLRISSTKTFLGVGPSVGFWADFLRFHLDLAAGGILQTVKYGGTDAGGARVAPAFEVGGGYTAGFFGTVGLGNRAYIRFHEDRTDLGWTLYASLFF